MKFGTVLGIVRLLANEIPVGYQKLVDTKSASIKGIVFSIINSSHSFDSYERQNDIPILSAIF